MNAPASPRSDLAARLLLELAARERRHDEEVRSLADQNVMLMDLLAREMAERVKAEDRLTALLSAGGPEEKFDPAGAPPF